jgi:aminoglycoside phosphotransferase (APT) family kinase protein
LNRNILVDATRVTAVLDWGSSIYGDFLFDLAWLTVWQPWYPAWSAVDLVAEARAHYRDIGLEVDDFGRRLRASELFIALDGQAFQAFIGDWGHLDGTIARTLDLARAPLPKG